MTTTEARLQIRRLTAADWPQVADIYAAGIATGDATFETAPPPWPAWDAEHRQDLRFVAVAGDGDTVAGWAAAGPVSDRSCYAGVVEDSVYVRSGYQGRGIGRLLLARLVAAASRAGIWTVQAGIFPENAASVALHRSCGFRVVGRRERLGLLRGVWRDVLLLEYNRPGPGPAPGTGQARMEVSLACTLTPAAASARLGQWREALARSVTQARRLGPGQLRLDLSGDAAALAALVLLAREEKICCPFFRFTFEAQASALAFVVEVPPDAEAVLDGFAELSAAR